MKQSPDSKVGEANMGPTWVLSAPGWPHVGHINLAIWEALEFKDMHVDKNNWFFACILAIIFCECLGMFAVLQYLQLLTWVFGHT